MGNFEILSQIRTDDVVLFLMIVFLVFYIRDEIRNKGMRRY